MATKMMLAEWTGETVGLNKKEMQHRNSPRYNNFIKNLAWLFKVSYTGRPTMKGDVTLHISLTTNYDWDAFNKQISDALEMGGVIKNDSQITKVVISVKRKQRPRNKWSGPLDKIGVTVIGEDDKCRT